MRFESTLNITGDGDNDGEAVFGGVDPARFDASTSQVSRAKPRCCC